jgi:hypothetical protein
MKKKTYNITIQCFIAALTALALGSCTRTLDLPDVGNERSITLLGELVADDSICFRGGESVPLKSSSTLRFELPDNMAVIITDTNGTKLPLTGFTDDASAALNTIQYSSSEKIKEGTTYNITATHATLGVAQATVTIPGKFAAAVLSTNDNVFGNDSVIEVSIHITDPAGVPNYYAIEALKQSMTVEGYFLYNGSWLTIPDNKELYDEEKANGTLTEKFDTIYYKTYTRHLLYCTDMNAEGAGTKVVYEPNRRVLIRDATFNGRDYIIKVYVKKDFMSIMSNYDKGRILLQVKSIPEDYFRFLKSYDEQVDNGVNSLTLPVKVKGNVVNGLGIIGGVYRHQFVIQHDTWTF